MKYPEDYINKIHCADCIDFMKGIPDNYINLIVTSPPYWNIHKYNKGNEIGFGQTLKQYIASLEKIFVQFKRITKDNGNILFNIMDCMRNGKLIRLSDLIINISPLELKERIIWYIPNKMPVTQNKYLVNKYEWLLHFVKSDNYVFNVDEMRRPSKYSKIDKREWKYNPKGKLLENVWEIPAKHLPNPVHPAMFPLEIPLRCIKAWSNINDMILEPFAGSGNTLIACKELGRKYIGIEINPEYCEIARRRISAIPELLF